MMSREKEVKEDDDDECFVHIGWSFKNGNGVYISIIISCLLLSRAMNFKGADKIEMRI